MAVVVEIATLRIMRIGFRRTVSWVAIYAVAAAQAHPLEAAIGLQVRKAHLDALSFIA